MLQVLGGVWALLLGMVLIMIGNGMQSTLMGVRGGIEGFSTFELSVITSGYFVGFLAGSRIAPRLIRHVGHVRVFAALGSFMSAGLLVFPLIVEPWLWTLLRVGLGFCLSGVYVTAESWLNNAATNRTRGTVLSAYMIAQTLGMIAAQGALNLADAGGFVLFILSSVLVSLSFAPILLSAQPMPPTQISKPMSLRQLYDRSPLGTVGTFLLGGVFAAQLGMAAVYGTAAGFGVREVSTFVAAIFAGSMLLQLPIGWLSDRIDRRLLILSVSAIGALTCGAGFWVGEGAFGLLLAAGFVMGGMASPLYSLLIAYTNDYLEVEDMPAASGGLVFIYGLGAIVGPLATGQIMQAAGPAGFWAFLGVVFAAIAVYAAWRMLRRPVTSDEARAYLGVLPTASPVAVEAAQEWYAEEAEREAEDAAAS
ncbi:MFS transporter [Limimaricola hongkongensis]|uniref:Transporter, Major facilitator superfamily n=1 Tax=Limimaricola hongkongensis DSM 17492 TaxID=1122180 RepID=A0A017H954_9RHOB|nr:MFS transporter [Limimaricola hongkongensis]EYD70906.1 Transporter, Major facilitator superfamily [Limimaricola hongkongensis DSM 17492]